jgi:hypothetical protein
MLVMGTTATGANVVKRMGSAPLARGRLKIPSFPLDERQLEEANVIIQTNLVEFSERHISFHGLSELLDGQI